MLELMSILTMSVFLVLGLIWIGKEVTAIRERWLDRRQPTAGEPEFVYDIYNPTSRYDWEGG